MSIYIKIILVICIEIVFTIVFKLISPKDKNVKISFNLKSILKGFIERTFVTLSLLSGFPHALTLFGALKLGTRLKKADDENTQEGRKNETIYNDYYLIGNFISISLCILYYNMLKSHV